MKRLILLVVFIAGCAGTVPDLSPIEAKLDSLTAQVDSLWYYSDVQGFLIEAVYGELIELRELALPGGGVYEIKPGDSLWGIAESELGGGWRWVEIYVLNYWSINKPDLIFPGQVLKVKE